MATHSSTLAWRIPWGRKESDTAEPLFTHSLHLFYRASLVAQWLKNLPAHAGDKGSVSVSERSPGEGNGNPLQCSCLESPMNRGAWCTTVHGAAKSQTQLSHGTTTTTNLFYLRGKAGIMRDHFVYLLLLRKISNINK